MNFKKRKTFIKCLSSLVSSVCVFQQPSVFAVPYKCGYKDDINKFEGINPILSFEKNSDNTYSIKQEQKKTFIHLMQNLPHDIKWKMVIDGKHHAKENCLIFDNDRPEMKGEPGYHNSVMRQWDLAMKYLSDESSAKIDAKKLQELHDMGVNYASDAKKGYSSGQCPMSVTNSNYKGVLEYFANSGLQCENKLARQGLLASIHSDYITEDSVKPGMVCRFDGACPFIDVYGMSGSNEGYCYTSGLLLNFGNTGSEIKFTSKLLEEFYETLDKIKSDSSFILPKFDLSTGYQTYQKLINDKLFVNNSFFTNKKVGDKRKNAVSDFVEEQYKEIIKNKAYTSNTKNEKIIELIVRVCRSLDQAHVFPDGNIRLCRLLMNMFLIQNGMLPAIYDDFNTLDCRDVEYLVNEVKQGQEKFVTLLKNNKDTIKELVGIGI